jgi:hypothetical protein
MSAGAFVEMLNDIARDELPSHGLERVMIDAGYHHDAITLEVCPHGEVGAASLVPFKLVFPRQELEDCASRTAVLELFRDKLRKLRRDRG